MITKLKEVYFILKKILKRIINKKIKKKKINHRTKIQKKILKIYGNIRPIKYSKYSN